MCQDKTEAYYVWNATMRGTTLFLVKPFTRMYSIISRPCFIWLYSTDNMRGGPSQREMGP